jgi:AcrR family transcriptional regulator
MKKQSEKTEYTKKIFAEAFCKLYCRKPFEKITVQEITRKAGFNRSTFYQYFSDIHEILEYVENDVLDYVKQKIIDGTISKLNASIIHEFVKLYEEKETYQNAILGDYGSKYFFEKMKKIIPLDGHGLNISNDNPLKPYLIEFHLATAFSLFQLWHRRKKDLSIEEFGDLVNSLQNNGLSAFMKFLSKNPNP